MASTYFTRTPASTGNRQTWTYSVWFKKSKIGASGYQYLFNCTDNATSTGRINSTENSTDSFSFIDDLIGVNLTTTAVYRDVSAWYHLVVVLDTTNATSTNRVKMYVNGSQITSFSTSTYPSQNANGTINLVSGSYAHHIGTYIGGQSFFDGLMASVYFIDGQALTPSSFGETDATTGIWKPKAYTGTYGTNGFFLKFENSGSLGLDSSGNGNNFTVNGTPTQTVDTPSNNFATMNPLRVPTGNPATFTNGNLTVATQSTGYYGGRSTIGMSTGKWYFEAKVAAQSAACGYIGIQNPDSYTPELFNSGSGAMAGYSSTGWSYNASGIITNNNTDSSYGNTYTLNDIISVALDLDNNKLYFAKNGTWQNSGVPTSGATGTGALSITSGLTYLFAVDDGSNGNSTTWDCNFGNGRFGTTAISSPYSDGAGLGKFQYQPPTGYYSLCTKNINVYG